MAAQKTVLIVEDDEVLLRALYLAFHNEKYTIASATNGEEALKITERLIPDAVISDILMPKMSGLDYLRDVKANPKLKHIPVIVLTNLEDSDSFDKAKALGAVDYFTKTDVNLSTLVKKVRDLIKP